MPVAYVYIGSEKYFLDSGPPVGFARDVKQRATVYLQ